MTAPFPYQPKPSILDRVMARLFPATQMLDPSIAPQVGQQARTQLAANLLYAGGASPQQRGTLSNIGAAIGGVDVNELMKNALQLQAYKQQQAAQQKIGQVIAANQSKPGETEKDLHARVLTMIGQLAGIPGSDALVERLTQAANATKPNQSRWSFQTIDENGVPVLYRINEDTGDKYRIGLGKQKEPTPQERTAGSQYESAAASIAAMQEIATRNPDAAKAAAAAVHAGGWGRLGKAYAALRGFTNDPDAQRFYTEYKNMILTVTPTYGGARPTQQLMDLEQAATLPAIGSGDFSTAFRHMQNRLHDLQAKAGRGMAPPSTDGVPQHPDNPWRH